jgi:selenocysteine-specific elongation factor
LRLPSAAYGPFLSHLEHELSDSGAYVHLSEHEIRFTQQQELRINGLLERLAQAGINAPHVRECREAVGDDVYEALIATGALTQLNEEVVFRTEEYRRFSDVIIDYLKKNETANAGQIRDLLGTSRKYAIALLEYLDQQHITRRSGDTRELLLHTREKN